MRTPRTLPCLASCNTHCAARLSSTSYPIRAHDAPAMGWPHSTQCLRSFSSSPPIAPAARTRHAALARTASFSATPRLVSPLQAGIPTLTLTLPLFRSRRALRAPSPRTAIRIVWACPRTTRSRALGVGVRVGMQKWSDGQRACRPARSLSGRDAKMY